MNPARPVPFVVGSGTALALGAVVLAGCTADADVATRNDDATTSEDTRPDNVRAVLDAHDDQTVVNDDEWSADDAQDVALSAPGGDGVERSPDGITITEGGVYRLSGSLAGTVTIDAPDDAQVILMLDGVDVAARDRPAIQALAADDVGVFLVDGAENSVASTGTYDETEEPNAALFADTDLTVSGNGSLAVDGAANDGIASKDDLVVLSGAITVTAADDGLRGKDSLTVRGGTISIDAPGDGLVSDQDDDEARGWVLIEGGTIDIDAGSDGIDGFTDAVVTGGDLTISAEEGIEAGAVAISGGTVDIAATDDGINGSAGTAESDADATGEGQNTTTASAGAARDAPAGNGFPASSDDDMPPGMGGAPGGDVPADVPGAAELPEGGPGDGPGGMQDTGEWILVSGGTTTIDADGDGMDSNGSIAISGGTVSIDGPATSGNGALDANGEISVSGGTLFALDAGGMSDSPSGESAQAWIAAAVSGEAGSSVEIVSEDGTVLYAAEAAKDFGALVFASADLADDHTYAIAVDGSEAAMATAGEALAGMRGGPRG